MIRLYEDIRLKYYTIEIIGISLLLLISTLLYGKTGNTLLFTLLILLTIIYILAVAFYFTKKASNRVKKLYEKIKANNKTKEDIEEIKRLAERCKNKELKELLENILKENKKRR